MEKEQENIEQYQKGFNEGYLLAKFLPDLSRKLEQIKESNDRLNGIKDGRDQFIEEKKKIILPSHLFQKSAKDKEIKNKDITPEKD